PKNTPQPQAYPRRTLRYRHAACCLVPLLRLPDLGAQPLDKIPWTHIRRPCGGRPRLGGVLSTQLGSVTKGECPQVARSGPYARGYFAGRQSKLFGAFWTQSSPLRPEPRLSRNLAMRAPRGAPASRKSHAPVAWGIPVDFLHLRQDRPEGVFGPHH